MVKKFVLYLMIILIGGGCAALPPLPPPVEQTLLPPDLVLPQKPEQEETYTLGPQDGLRITIYDNPDLSREVVVSADGSFVYPLIGQVQATGLTVRQLEQELTRRLADGYLVEPQVSVTVTQYQSQKVYVLGAVRSPGIYTLRQDTTLLELISKAGGPTGDAGLEVLVVKASEATPEGKNLPLIRVDLEKLLAGEIQQPIAIGEADTIYVPQQRYFFVYGEVQRPGRYPLERNTTVFKAITLAGGFTRFAAKRRLKVQRVIDEVPQEFHAQMNDRLQAEDILVVPQSYF
ncbi:MAG: hypothetical protein D6736_07460 [Nitrospinota bacterium]|nr:MAG: hypothetical protein D6736_07460 [Nitrospinota bacterium]